MPHVPLTTIPLASTFSAINDKCRDTSHTHTSQHSLVHLLIKCTMRTPLSFATLRTDLRNYLFYSATRQRPTLITLPSSAAQRYTRTIFRETKTCRTLRREVLTLKVPTFLQRRAEFPSVNSVHANSVEPKRDNNYNSDFSAPLIETSRQEQLPKETALIFNNARY